MCAGRRGKSLTQVNATGAQGDSLPTLLMRVAGSRSQPGVRCVARSVILLINLPGSRRQVN